jgi:hypothetical protein
MDMIMNTICSIIKYMYHNSILLIFMMKVKYTEKRTKISSESINSFNMDMVLA